MSKPAPIRVLGIGNLLLSDDGLGIHALRALEQDPPAGVELIDLGTGLLHAAGFLEDAERVLVLDAVQCSQPVGTIVRVAADHLQADATPGSLHSVGLISALAWVPEERRPSDLWVLGMQPDDLSMGMSLSPPLQEAFPAYLAAVREHLALWSTTPFIQNASSCGVSL